MGDNMNDDLGHHLRDEVPPPRVGYWNAIDEAVRDVANEGVDTADVLVRPMGMSERRNDLSARLMAAAAAIAVLAAAAAGVFVATSDNDPTVTEAAAESDVNVTSNLEDTGDSVVTTGPVTTLVEPLVTTEQETTAQPLVTTITPFEFPALADGAERRCFVGAETAPSARLVIETAPDGSVRSGQADTDSDLVEGGVGEAFGAEGWLVMTTQTVGGLFYGNAWFESADSVSLSEDFWALAVDCSMQDQRMVAAAQAAQAAVLPPVDDPVLAPGPHCFVDQAGHPGIDSIRLEVYDDGTVDFDASSGEADSAGLVEFGTGFFVKESTLAIDLTTVSGDQASRRTEIFELTEGGLAFGLGFFNVAIDCAD